MRIFEKLIEKIKKSASQRGYTCDACGKEIFDYPMHRICEDCEQTLFQNKNRSCEKCGRQTVSQGICLNCKKSLPSFTKGFSPFVYQGKTAALVNRIKNGKQRLAYFFGEQMTEYLLQNCSEIFTNNGGRYALNEEYLEKPPLLIPVPMTQSDLRKRGYNQALELVKVVEETLKKQGVSVEMDDSLLQKVKQTLPQKQRSYFERKENLSGAFRVHKRAKCKDRTIILIDDIMTTGATGNECGARLLGAGAKRVIFLTAASLSEQK